MRANPVLLQKKYARVIMLFSQMVNITLEEALDFFYSSTVYKLMRSGVSDKHCMSDYYLAQDLEEEWKK